MYLISETLVPYLLNRGTLTPDMIVDGGVMIIETARRNRNFRVELTPDFGVFVKQAAGRDTNSADTLRREAAFYQLLNDDLGELARLVPTLLDHDPVRCALTLAKLPNSQSLSQIILTGGDYHPGLAALVGQHLARLHCTDFTVLSPHMISILPRHSPASLTAIVAGRGSAAMLAEWTGQTVAEQLGKRSINWRFTHLVHNDLKPDNIQICGAPEAASAQEVKLVDWELVDLGDPCWDIVCMLVGLIQLWAVRTHDDDDFPGLAEAIFLGRVNVPAGLHLAAARFWQSYCEQRVLDQPSRRLLAAQCADVLGARLAVVAYEMAVGNEKLPSAALFLSHLTARAMADPVGSMRVLVGLQ